MTRELNTEEEPKTSASSFGLDERFEGLYGITKEYAEDLHLLIRAVDFYQDPISKWTLREIQDNKEDGDPSCGWPHILEQWVKMEFIEQWP